MGNLQLCIWGHQHGSIYVVNGARWRIEIFYAARYRQTRDFLLSNLKRKAFRYHSLTPVWATV